MVSSGRRLAYASWPFTREPPDAAPVFSRPVAGRLLRPLCLLWLVRRVRRGCDPGGAPVIPLIHDDLHLSEAQVGLLIGLPLGCSRRPRFRARCWWRASGCAARC